MLVKNEKIITAYDTYLGDIKLKRISWCLFGFIPVFIEYKLIG